MDIEQLHEIKKVSDTALVYLNNEVQNFYNNVTNGLPVEEKVRIALTLPKCEASYTILKKLKNDGMLPSEIPDEIKVGTKHTKEQLLEKITDMKETSTAFYHKAIGIGNHPFIEFAGLLNEYITLCKNALEEGIDFTECNTHANFKLPAQPWNKEYINEKLDCIFTGDFEML